MDEILLRIQELEERIRKLEGRGSLSDVSLRDTFFVVDMQGNLQLVRGKPPEHYETPIIKTEYTLEDFRAGKIPKNTLERFRFKNRNVIFRGEYIVDPLSFEGMVIQKILDEQMNSREPDLEKRLEIRKMTMEQAIEYVTKNRQK